MTASPCCSGHRACRARPALLVVVAVVAAAPPAARPEPPPASPALVAEALFLCDMLPPGGRDVNVAVLVAEGEPDPADGRAPLHATPRVQLALALGERVGLTADVALASEGRVAVHAPGASLKLLLRDPAGGRTGLAASLDLLGSTHDVAESEAGVGVGAIRAVGPLALRAAASVATGVRTWSPHLHAGVSAALALGRRWRALAETIADVHQGEVAVSAGPTLKVALGEGTALMAGALFEVRRGAGRPSVLVQLTRSM